MGLQVQALESDFLALAHSPGLLSPSGLSCEIARSQLHLLPRCNYKNYVTQCGRSPRSAHLEHLSKPISTSSWSPSHSDGGSPHLELHDFLPTSWEALAGDMTSCTRNSLHSYTWINILSLPQNPVLCLFSLLTTHFQPEPLSVVYTTDSPQCCPLLWSHEASTPTSLFHCVIRTWALESLATSFRACGVSLVDVIWLFAY